MKILLIEDEPKIANAIQRGLKLEKYIVEVYNDGESGLGAALGDGNYDLMILDPPREGLSGPLRQWLASAGPPLVVYVSCDPATLARDSRVLLDGGYNMNLLSMYDFYPQTAHIESLAVFCRKGNSEQ